MADYTLKRVDRFPQGTSVSAYPASNWPALGDDTVPSGNPVGSATDTQVMGAASLTFTGLTEGVKYFAHADIGGDDRYVAFVAIASAGSTSGLTDAELRASPVNVEPAVDKNAGAAGADTLRAVTASDSPEVATLGAVADAAAAAGGTGSISAKLRNTTALLDAIRTAAELIDNAVAGSEMQVDVVGPLPAGTNNIGDIDVLTVPSDPFGANADAAAAAGGAGSISAKLRHISSAIDSVKTAVELLDNAIAGSEMQVDVVGALPAGNNIMGRVVPVPAATGGASTHKTISAASTNATSVKASAGQIYAIVAHNINAAVRYLKIYNKASAPTVGTDTPVLTLPIPGNAAGAGFVLPVAVGVALSTGIAFALTTGVADSDTGAVAANEIVVDLVYA